MSSQIVVRHSKLADFEHDFEVWIICWRISNVYQFTIVILRECHPAQQGDENRAALSTNSRPFFADSQRTIMTYVIAKWQCKTLLHQESLSKLCPGTPSQTANAKGMHLRLSPAFWCERLSAQSGISEQLIRGICCGFTKSENYAKNWRSSLSVSITCLCSF